MSSRPDLRLDWATPEAARYACSRWHYSKTMPANKSNRIGAWEDSKFIGCIIFGLGASPSLGKPYGLGIFQTCELTRVALKRHEWPVTRMIKIAKSMLVRKNPNLRLIVSFADPFHAHHGGIYQGGGWLYAGMSAASKVWKLKNGDLADQRRFNGHGHNSKKSVPLGAELIRTPGKHRYLMPLDDEMRQHIEPLRKPYPKREKQAMAGPPAQRRGSADLHAPTGMVEGRGNFPPIKDAT